MLDSRERDKAAFFAVEMATRKATLLAADDEADLVEVSFDDRRPIAARGRLKRERAGSRLAQRKMRAAECHQCAEAQRRETCEYA